MLYENMTRHVVNCFRCCISECIKAPCHHGQESGQPHVVFFEIPGTTEHLARKF